MFTLSPLLEVSLPFATTQPDPGNLIVPRKHFSSKDEDLKSHLSQNLIFSLTLQQRFEHRRVNAVTPVLLSQELWIELCPYKDRSLS